MNENDEEETGCVVCCRQLKPGEGRYNTLGGQVCTNGYFPSLFLEKNEDGELVGHVTETD